MLEALITRWLGELAGKINNGYAHVAIEHEGWVYELTEVGLSEAKTPYCFADYYERVLSCPIWLHNGQYTDVVSYRWRVSVIALLKKLFSLPLLEDEYICTDVIALLFDVPITHPTPEELLFDTKCDCLLKFGKTITELLCRDTCITPDVQTVVRVTTWQSMMMGVVSALGAGHLIRKGHLPW
jgi:hypothetical protein